VRPMRNSSDFKFAVVFDHRIEDLLHQVRIDQVAFGLDDFLLHGVLSGYRGAAVGCKRTDQTSPGKLLKQSRVGSKGLVF
jgi:hypothetical protein